MGLLDWVVWINYFTHLSMEHHFGFKFWAAKVPNKKKAESFCFLINLGGLSLYLSLRNLKLIKSTLTEINFQL
jgi:hypothetical protein